MQALNDALCLRGLEDQSTMNVLAQAPSTWRQGSWRDELDLDVSIHSVHTIETLILPRSDLIGIPDVRNPRHSY